MKTTEFEKLTISTSCMNRNDMLVQTVPTWLKFPVKEILIVDWNSNEKVSDTLKNHNIRDERIRIVRVDNELFYQHSLARNLKIKEVETEWVLSVDADVKIFNSFFDNIYVLNGRKYYCLPLAGEMDSRFGTTLFRKMDYIAIGGCNTNMKGWGYEDLDLADRMIRSGCKHLTFNKDCLFHIQHDDIRRTENCEVKNKWESNSKNMYIGSKEDVLDFVSYNGNFKVEYVR